MGIFDFLSGPIKGLVEALGSVIDDLHTSDEEKADAQAKLIAATAAAQLEIERELTKTIEAQERILIAELKQDDKYTKRARPTVVYVGLAAFVFNYVLVPNAAALFGTIITPAEFPAEFWYGWSGIVATWTVGRSYEKSRNGHKENGTTSTIMRAITG